MVFLYNPWIPRGDDKMGHYVHYIGGGIVDSKIYETGNAAKSFKSPMKELNEQTVHCNFVMDETYHQNLKLIAIRKGDSLKSVLQEAISDYLDKNSSLL